MEEITLNANVQYDDLKGTVAIDNNDMNGLFEFAKKYGIDTKKYYLIGLNYTKEQSYEYISIYATSKAHNYDDVEQLLSSLENDDFLEVVEFKINNITLDDYLPFVKRLNFVVTSHQNLISKTILVTDQQNINE